MWSELSGRQKAGLIGLAIVVALVAGYWIGRSSKAEEVKPMVQQPLELGGKGQGSLGSEPGKQSEPSEKVPIRVSVKGAVVAPGTYNLVKGDRVEDAILAAGGGTGDADWDSVNLAKILKDGDEVDVKRLPGKNVDELDWPIPINEATVEQLEMIPGIGPSMATDIVRWRSEVGPIEGVQDLERIPGFGPETVRRILPYVRFN